MRQSISFGNFIPDTPVATAVAGIKSRRPLSNVRVIEYGPWLNAAYGARLLADLGAEIIKIESPYGDEPMRLHGPFPKDIPGMETSAQHLFNNANKLGVTLDVTTFTGRNLFLQLTNAADVLIDGTQPGHLNGLGLTHDTLAKTNPGLITIAVSSLGRAGPYKHYRGYDATSWHGSGASHVWMGEPDRHPLQGAYYHASHWGANAIAAATTIALQARTTTSRGQFIDISEAESLATLYIAVEVSDHLMNGTERSRVGLRLDGQAPTALLPCKDGYVYLMALTDQQWDGLVKAMGNPDWAQSELFHGGGRQRAVYAREIYDLLRPWLLDHTGQEIFDSCQANGAPAAVLYSVADLLTNEHLAERGYFIDVAEEELGTLRFPGPPFRFSSTAPDLDDSQQSCPGTNRRDHNSLAPWAVTRRAPRLGEHNEAIYCHMLGLQRPELTMLRRAGVI